MDQQGSVILHKLRSSTVPFLMLLVFFVLLALRVIWPLSRLLVWSAVLSFFTYPIYSFIHLKIFRGRWSYFASALNTVLILFLLVLPMAVLLATAINELGRLYQFFAEWIPTVQDRSLGEILSIPQIDGIISKYPGLSELSLWRELASNLPALLASFIARLPKELLGNVFQLSFSLMVIMVGTFFLTHDGEIFLSFVRGMLPLSPSERDIFFMRARQMLYALFYGIIMTAGVQAALGGVGWWFVGLPNPVLFALLMFFLAMLPMIGTPLVIVPGAVYLWATGDTKHALILLAWGFVVVGSIDNVLRPLFISKGTKVHILMIFAGILGGISVWGFLGLFMGPLVLSVAYFVLSLYHGAMFSPEEAIPPAKKPEQDHDRRTQN